MSDELKAATENAEHQYWYPTLVDAVYLARMRVDYPEHAHLSDEALREEFECESKYATNWDHVGDAYSEYEPLADAYVELRQSYLTNLSAHESQAAKPSGLTNRKNDCPVTRCVRNALYSTDLSPTEDDVQSIVISLKEDFPNITSDKRPSFVMTFEEYCNRMYSLPDHRAELVEIGDGHCEVHVFTVEPNQPPIGEGE